MHVLISAKRSREERAAAAARLTLAPRVRAVASAAAQGPALAGPSTVVATAHGVLRATIVTDAVTDRPADSGWGTWGTVDSLPDSWATAVLAHRLTRGQGKSVDSEDFGVLGIAALALDGAQHPDVDALAGLDNRSLQVLAALAEAESVRAAAVALGMHHSTVRARHESLIRELGYDPRTAIGRARFKLADMLLRIRESSDT